VGVINAGDLDQRITLQQRGSSVDVLGQPVRSWSNVVTVWAQAQPLRGKEFTSNSGAGDSAQIRFRIRYRSDVAADWRVVWRGEIFGLVAPPIDVLGKKAVLELMCASGVGDAS
jgi:SPP1 family predicted phage head-tail adaptor